MSRAGAPSPPLEPIGYEALARRFELELLPYFRRSLTGPRARTTERIDHQERHIYPLAYRPGHDASMLEGHLEFALKHEGVHLALLAALFRRLERADLERYVASRPTGQYARRVWFLFEWLTGERLDLPDATMGNYVEVLDRKRYYAAENRPSRRHRVYNNLPGSPGFCPMVRRTPELAAYEARQLGDKARAVLARFPKNVLDRANDHLYLKETRSSFAIERETPDHQRGARFVELLKRADEIERLDELALVELQRAIVDPRFATDGFRATQVYVAQTRADWSQSVHYVAPKPDDLPGLMRQYLQAYERIGWGSLDPVVQAAIVSFAFVFLHPFDDGNGRIHRFLVHHVISRSGFVPKGVILPVSAVMLAERADYDRALETFSRPLLAHLDYQLDNDGIMRVKNETVDYYRYIDLTEAASYLYSVVARTIERDLVEEVEFILRHDVATEEMQAIVDLPNRELELFLRLCLQNGGRVSKTKRSRFEMLSESEIAQLEEVVQRVFLKQDS